MNRFTAGLGLTGAAIFLTSRFYRNWGCTKEEAAMPLPGDRLIMPPVVQTTAAVTVNASPAAVWSSLVQMGSAGVGPSHSALVTGPLELDAPSASTNGSGQGLRSGDMVRLVPAGWSGIRVGIKLTVVQVTNNSEIVLRTASAQAPFETAVSIRVEPHWQNQSRLLLRVVVGLRWPAEVFVVNLAGPLFSLLIRRALLGVKKHAEATVEAQHELAGSSE